MAINAVVVRNSDGGWSFTWAVGTAPYNIWLNGFLISTEAAESFSYNEGDYLDTPPPLEILDSGDPADNETTPPYVTIQWRGKLAAGGYAIEQFISAAWVEVGYAMERQRGYYQYKSDALDDNTSHLFRVIAIDPVGNEGTPLAFTMEMVRNPAPPDVDLSFNTAGDLVVS